MIYSDQKKFIFFAAGKTGTTSMEEALAEYSDEIPFEYDKKRFDRHIPPEYAKANLPKDIWDSYFKFAFVRNPWDWVISFYFFMWPNVYRPYKQKIRTWPYYLLQIGKRNWGTFDERCFWLIWEHMKKFRRGIDSDNRYQHRFLSDSNGRLLVDYVGRYERLQDDFELICDRIGAPGRRLPMRNKSKYRGKRYVDYYTPETIALVRQHYARDIREFGYTFDV
ncbi:MAG: sulfotransferase family 2 domain-containing protein [Arenicellales bacterium]